MDQILSLKWPIFRFVAYIEVTPVLRIIGNALLTDKLPDLNEICKWISGLKKNYG